MQKFHISTKKLALISLLTALEIVLSRFLSVNTNGVKIGFAFIPVVICAMCFGAVPCGITSALADFIGAMLFPFGPYHPGFTIVAFFTGFVYGFLLRNNGNISKSRFTVRLVTSAVVNNSLFGLLVNTLWVSQLYGSKSYLAWFICRVPEYLIMIPVIVIVTPLLVPVVKRINK